MQIETKLNIGDEVHFIANKKAVKSIVQGMRIEVIRLELGSEVGVTYICNNDSDKQVGLKVGEADAYKTKEELLASL